MSNFQSKANRILLLLFLVGTLTAFGYSKALQKSGTQEVPLLIKWSLQPGVSRYRLQIATDAEFADIVFDEAVTGNEYTVKVLPRGHYYWHVAPAVQETGRFSNASPVDSTGAIPEGAPDVKPMDASALIRSGWRVVSASVLEPVLVGKVQQSGLVLIAADHKGGVFAFDGTTGEPRWSRAANLAKRRDGVIPSPVIANSAKLSRLLLLSQSGVAAVDLTNGAIVWEKNIEGEPIALAAVDFGGGGEADFVVVTNLPSAAIVLDAATGDIVSQTRLFAPVVAQPVRFDVGSDRGFIICEKGGLIDIRDRKGVRLRYTKLDTETTTSPVMARTGRETLVVVGTERGLVALDAATLKPRWHAETPGNAPTGSLSVADLESKGTDYVVMITKVGEVTVFDSSDGKILWNSKGAERANSVGFADVNSDGHLDVLLPNSAGNVKVMSGRDGSLVFDSADEPGSALSSGIRASRSDLLTAKGPAGTGTWLFLSDGTGPGLRALLIGKPVTGVANR
jgi:outer membrane protein assembly factor BamB